MKGNHSLCDVPTTGWGVLVVVNLGFVLVAVVVGTRPRSFLLEKRTIFAFINGHAVIPPL